MLTKRGAGIVAALGGLFAVVFVTGDAVAQDEKSYNSLFCNSTSDVLWSGFGSAMNETSGTINCPILRDDSGTGLPAIAVEFINEVDFSVFVCSVRWLQEDSSSGTGRGVSEQKSTSTAGVGQFVFDDVTDYTDGSGTFSLTSGGEGTMWLTCTMQGPDELIQYNVLENQF